MIHTRVIIGLAQWTQGGYTDLFDPVFTGALYAAPNDNFAGATSGSLTYTGHPGFGLDASKGDATYSGSKLQVLALQVLCCIKT